jgi:hypothetical protein
VGPDLPPRARAQCQIPQMPMLPGDAERHPAMVREYHAIAEEIQRECQHIALLDRMHSLKARRARCRRGAGRPRPSAAAPQLAWPCCSMRVC